MLAQYPNAARLHRDIAKLSCLLRCPFGEIFDEDALWTLAESKRKDGLRRAFSSLLGDFDNRIRLVQGRADGVPLGTVKLFGASKLSEHRPGRRIADILQGGIACAVVSKDGSPSEWRLTGIHEFLPEGRLLEKCEVSLEALAKAFSHRPKDVPFPAITKWPFQVRTGSSADGYSVYLLAQKLMQFE
jgi:hypothetical protein